MLGMSKVNVCNRIKKTLENDQRLNFQLVFNGCYELDELCWFVERKTNTEVSTKTSQIPANTRKISTTRTIRLPLRA